MTNNPIRLRVERRDSGFITAIGAPGREQVRTKFFREHFGVGPGQTIEERRKSGGLVLCIGGQPAGWLREYRAAHRALPPAPKRRRSMPEIMARIDELEAGATELWP
jgi:hypothetical protein